MVALLGALAAAVITVTRLETMIALGYRQADETAYAAGAAFERALHDLAAVNDWSLVLATGPSSSFFDGDPYPTTPGGRVLDPGQLTVDRQRASEARDPPARFGGDAPRWRLYARGPLAALLPPGRLSPGPYLLVWVSDDGEDGDGWADRDANGRLLVHAEAHGEGAARRAVEGAVGRTAGGQLRLLTWRQIR